MSIKFKIFTLLFGCLVLISGFLIAYTVIVLTNNLKGTALEQLNIVTENAANRITILNKEVETAVKDMGQIILNTVDLKKAKGNTANYMSTYLKQVTPEIREITRNTEGVVGGYGYFNVETYKDVYAVWCLYGKNAEDNTKFECTNEFEPLKTFYPENQAMVWYFAPIIEKKPVWTDLYFDEQLKTTCVSYVEPMIKDGVVVGMVGVDTSFKAREEIIDSLKIFKDGYALLVDNKQKIINTERGSDKQNQLYAAEVATQSRQSEKGVIEKQDTYLAFRKLSSGQTIIVVASKNDIFSSINSIFRDYILLNLGMVILILIFGYIFSSTVLGPIGVLKDATGKINTGDYVEVNIKSKDELGQLARAFNLMSSNLKTSMMKLEENEAILEETVKKRTQELDEKIIELEKINQLMEGRELKMIELKERINALENKT